MLPSTSKGMQRLGPLSTCASELANITVQRSSRMPTLLLYCNIAKKNSPCLLWSSHRRRWWEIQNRYWTYTSPCKGRAESWDWVYTCPFYRSGSKKPTKYLIALAHWMLVVGSRISAPLRMEELMRRVAGTQFYKSAKPTRPSKKGIALTSGIDITFRLSLASNFSSSRRYDNCACLENNWNTMDYRRWWRGRY